jgi:thiol-disulfide isomerase/thioredoxin
MANAPKTPSPPRPSGSRSPDRSTASAQRRRLYLAGGAGALVVVLIAVFLSVSLMDGHGSASTSGSTGVFRIAPASQAQVENVPVAVLLAAAKAKPAVARPPTPLPAGASALTHNGKPEIFYMGANYCPYCAAERWAIVMALSKFGTFTGLMGTSSSVADIYPATPTFTFYSSNYKSPYLSFVPVETEGNTANSSGTYPRLQTPTASELAVLHKWDAPPYVPSEFAGSVPFLDLGGRYILIGAQYDATHIAGWTFTSAASYLTSGNNATSKGVEAAAGYLTKCLCVLTHNQPASACSTAKG